MGNWQEHTHMQNGSVDHMACYQRPAAQSTCCESCQTLGSWSSIARCWCGKALLGHYDRQICTFCHRCQSLSGSPASVLAHHPDHNMKQQHKQLQ